MTKTYRIEVQPYMALESPGSEKVTVWMNDATGTRVVSHSIDKFGVASEDALRTLSDLLTTNSLGVKAVGDSGIFTDGVCGFLDANDDWEYEPDFDYVEECFCGSDDPEEGEDYQVWAEAPFSALAKRIAGCLNYLAGEIDCGVDFEAR